MPLRILFSSFFLFAGRCRAFAAVKPFAFRGQKIRAGTKRLLLLPVLAGQASPVLPVPCFRGAADSRRPWTRRSSGMVSTNIIARCIHVAD